MEAEFGGKTVLRPVVKALPNAHQGAGDQKNAEGAGNAGNAGKKAENRKAEGDDLGLSELVAEHSRGNLHEGVGQKEDAADEAYLGIGELKLAANERLHRVENHAVGVDEDPAEKEEQDGNFPVGLVFACAGRTRHGLPPMGKEMEGLRLVFIL